MATLYNSHYKLPWIIWSRTYQFTLAAYGYQPDATIAHGLPFIPLLLGQWSVNANFNPSYDIHIDVPGGSIGGQPEKACVISADASYVHILAVNNTSSNMTFYFRLMAFAPPNYAGEVSPVKYNSPFSFNSHYRYQQIYMQGQSSGIVNHNLGYLPQAKVWSLSGNQVVPSIGILTTSTLKCAVSGSYYYHIYKDRF